MGFELGETTGVTNDFIYAVGLGYSPAPAITFVAGVLGRYALDVTRRKVDNLTVKRPWTGRSTT